MAFLWINEFKSLGFDERGYWIQAGEQPAVAEQVIAVDTSSAPSSAFDAQTCLVELHTDVDCHIAFGTSPTASKTSGGTMLMAAGETRYYGVPVGASYKVAVIDNT